MAPKAGHVFKPLRERFEEKYMPEPNSGCWLWTGTMNDHGYGLIYVGMGKEVRAHRFSYELHKGPIPADLELDHLCRVRSCVNPDHLEPVTHAENTRRGNAGAHNSKRTHCIRNHAFAEHGFIDRTGHRQCRICVREWRRAYRRRTGA